MDRVRFIEHRGKRVLLLDYTDLTDEKEMLAMIEERKRVIAAQPRNSVLLLVDVTGARFTRNALSRVKEAAALDRPHVRRTVLVGSHTLPPTVVSAVASFAAQNYPKFETRAEGLDWLVAQEDASQTSSQAKAG